MQQWWRRTWAWLRANWLTVAIWSSVLLVANWTYLTQPISYTHDYLHGARIAEMTRGLLEGQLPVIWSQNFGFGYGMPLFEFYAPLPYLVGSIVHLLGFDLVTVTKVLYIGLSIGTMWGMYLWAREWCERPTAALAGGMLTLASYRAVDTMVRGAMSEAWAIMALPWLLVGITRIWRGEKNGFWLAFGGGVVLLVSHNITAMLAAPLLLLYVGCLLLWVPAGKGRIWPQLAVCALAILGASLWYWGPALSEKELTQVDTWILGDYFDYHKHFLYIRQFFRDNFDYGGSGWGDQDGLSFFLGWAQWLGLAISVSAGGWQWWQSRRRDNKMDKKCANIYFFAGVTVIFGLTLTMTLLKTAWLWELLADWLAFAQFPWRFLGVAIVWLALLGAVGIEWLPRAWRAPVTVSLWLVLLATGAHYYAGHDFLEEPGFYQGEPAYIREVMSPVLVDYLPRAADNVWEALPESTKVLNSEEQPGVLVEHMHEKLYHFDNEASRSVELAIHNYPGWRAEIDGQPVAIQTSKRGNIQVELPAGGSNLGLKLALTPWRWGANAISLVTWTAVMGYGIGGPWQKRKR